MLQVFVVQLAFCFSAEGQLRSRICMYTDYTWPTDLHKVICTAEYAVDTYLQLNLYAISHKNTDMLITVKFVSCKGSGFDTEYMMSYITNRALLVFDSSPLTVKERLNF